MEIQEYFSEHNWSSGWVIWSILAHQAHLAQSYFLWFSDQSIQAIALDFILQTKTFAVTEDKSLVKSEQCLYDLRDHITFYKRSYFFGQLVSWLVGWSVEQTFKMRKTANSDVFFHSHHLSCFTTFIFILLFIHYFVHSFVHSFIHLFIHSFICSFIHSFIHLFLHAQIPNQRGAPIGHNLALFNIFIKVPIPLHCSNPAYKAFFHGYATSIWWTTFLIRSVYIGWLYGHEVGP